MEPGYVPDPAPTMEGCVAYGGHDHSCPWGYRESYRVLSDATRLAWLRRLVAATTVAAVDELVVSLALAQAGCVSACLVRPVRMGNGWVVPSAAIDEDARRVVVDLMQQGLGRQSSADGCHLAFRVGTDEPVVLVTSFPQRCMSPTVSWPARSGCSARCSRFPICPVPTWTCRTCCAVSMTFCVR